MYACPVRPPRCARCKGIVKILLSGTRLHTACTKCGRTATSRPEGK
jgi:hypothetical protein